MVISPKEWTPFSDYHEKVTALKKMGLIPPSHNYVRQFTYCGGCTDKPVICTVEGTAGEHAVVIRIEDELHCIHIDCLAEMQKGQYRLPEEYVVLDLETTGFSRKRDEIIEIAALKFGSNGKISEFNTLVKPRGELSPRAMQVNCIFPAMVCDAPCIEDVMPRFRDFIGTLPLVAHNASFDMGFLKVQYDSFGWDLSNTVFDTLRLSQKAFPLLECHKLNYLKEYFEIETDASHRALPDVMATAELFVRCYLELQNGDDEGLLPEIHKNKIHILDIKPPSEDDGYKPLAGKTLVFTGELSISRQQASQLAAGAGATVRTSVSVRTDYLVVGIQDPKKVGEDGLSGSERKARELNSAGCANIRNINEQQFIDLLETEEGALIGAD